MSFLSELVEALARKAMDAKVLDRVGKEFLTGAERPGTFERGKEFAKSPHGLGAQFDWGAPEQDILRWGEGVKIFKNPRDHTERTVSYSLSPEDFKKNAEIFDNFKEYQGKLPKNAKLYTFDTGPLNQGSGDGAKAYATMYGDLLRDPDAHNIKEYLTGSNRYRNNYSLASAIMRQPDAGKRLLPAIEQFQNIPVNVGEFHLASPERQVGALQVEGALQTLRNLRNYQLSERTPEGIKRQLDTLPSTLTSTMSPGDLRGALDLLNRNNPAVRSTGPRTLRKLGIVNDAMAGYEVDPAAFRGLEFRQGGLVQAGLCNCAER